MGHKHVTFRALGVGSVTILQYHKCVLHAELQKMDLEVGLDFLLPLSPIHHAKNHVHSLH